MARNAVTRVVVDYLPDERGHRTFFDVISRSSGELNGQAAVIAPAQSSSWFAPVGALARGVTGANAAIAQGRAAVIAPRSSELMHQTTTTDAAVADVFRSRMARGSR